MNIFCYRKEQICRYTIYHVASNENSSPDAEYEGIISNVFSSRAVSQIVDFFLDHKEFDYSPGEIAKKTGLSFRTIFRELPNLEKNQIVYISRKIGKTSMYRLNTDFQAVAHLEKFVLEMSQFSIKEIDGSSNRDDIYQESTEATRNRSAGPTYL
jgi:DNA-binding transcriptional regulator YhcF (GntR family)